MCGRLHRLQRFGLLCGGYFYRFCSGVFHNGFIGRLLFCLRHGQGGPFRLFGQILRGLFQFEAVQQLLQRLGKAREFLAGGRALLRCGGVGLHNGGDLIYDLPDLGDGLGLLIAETRDLVDILYHAPRLAHHLLQGGGGKAGDFCAAPHGAHGMLDQIRRALGGFIALSGQIAHLARHHGKALACGPGPGSLNGRVQRQDVGLESDILDGFNDLADLFGAGANLLHSLNHAPHLRVARLNAFTHAAGPRIELRGYHSVAAHLLGDLAEGGGQLLYRSRLLRGALGHPLGTARHLLGAARHLLGNLPHPLEGRVERIHHVGYALCHGDEVSLENRPGCGGQIPGLELAHHPGNIANIPIQLLYHGAHTDRKVTQLIFGVIADLRFQVATGNPGSRSLERVHRAGDTPHDEAA